MTLEVEMKFAAPDHAALRSRLEGMGAAAMGAVRQEDQYFNHPARDFATTDEAVRLRLDGGENRITYKGPKLDAATKTRREIEVGFEHGAEARDQMAQLLVELGFRPVLVVAKTRERFELVRGDRHFEIGLDSVDGLGEFAEVETLADADSLPEARAAVLELAAELGLSTSERRSYLEMLLERLK